MTAQHSHWTGAAVTVLLVILGDVAGRRVVVAYTLARFSCSRSSKTPKFCHDILRQMIHHVG